MTVATPGHDAAVMADTATAATVSDGDTSDEQHQQNQRPSFEDFWRRSKTAHRAGNVTFLPSKGVVGEINTTEDDTSSAPATSVDESNTATASTTDGRSAAVTKAQARRAQVRRAQIQHRQRKANYTKELEMDIARLRDMIEQAETASRGLRTENAALRRDLSRRAVASGRMNLGRPRLTTPPKPVEQRLDDLSLSPPDVPSGRQVSPGNSSSNGAVAVEADFFVTPPTQPEMTSGSEMGVEDAAADITMTGTGTAKPTKDEAEAARVAAACTVRMDMSELTMTPVYRVSGTPSPASSSESVDDFSSVSSNRGGVPGASTAATSMASPEMTMATATTMTNTDFNRPLSPSKPPLAGGLTQEQTELVINFILALENICWNHFECSYFNYQAYDPEDPAGLENGHALMASSLALQQAGPEVFTQITTIDTTLQANGPLACRRIPPGTVEWRATGLTLDRLYGLAAALNPPDRELAPVQAWFELVRGWGPDVALDARVLDDLKRALRGVVRCLQFGAVIQRAVFDDAVDRAVGRHFPDLLAAVVAARAELAAQQQQQQQQQQRWDDEFGAASGGGGAGLDLGVAGGQVGDCGCHHE